MKKANQTIIAEIRSEYKRSDFGELVRGKYAGRVATETNIVVLEAEVAKVFPNDEAVNKALRGLIDSAATTARLVRHSTGRAKKRRAAHAGR
jgi:hypothetical protein